MSLAAADVTGSRPPRGSGAHRGARPNDPARTTRRWSVAVLAAATVVLLGYVLLLLAMAQLLAVAWNALAAGDAVSVDPLAVGLDVAPVLLVGWCTGMAASAGLSGSEVLGARATGLVAGAVGVLCGLAVLALTGLV